jgi:uncharacterized protein with FMN-binding domain
MKQLVFGIVVFGVFIIYALSQNQSSNAVSVNPVPTITVTVPEQTASPSTTPVVSTVIPTKNISGFNDGSYTGNSADAFYGFIQVRATISSGKLTDVVFLQHPNDRQTSVEINDYAMPILKSEAINAQSSNVDIVSGATDSSIAFIQSLQKALDQAKTSSSI